MFFNMVGPKWSTLSGKNGPKDQITMALYTIDQQMFVGILGWLKMRKFLKSASPYVDWYSFWSKKL